MKETIEKKKKEILYKIEVLNILKKTNKELLEKPVVTRESQIDEFRNKLEKKDQYLYQILNEHYEMFDDDLNISGITAFESDIESEQEEINELEFKEFQKEILIKQEKHNKIQQKYLKKDNEYKEQLQIDNQEQINSNKNIANLTKVLAIGVFLQALKYIYEFLDSIYRPYLTKVGFVLLFVVSFFIFLYMIIDLLKDITSEYQKYFNKTSFGLLILGVIIIIVGYFPKFENFKSPELTENKIFKDLKLEQEKTNNLILNLTESNNKIINLEYCLTNLEENKSFKICLNKTKE
jgi:hypothetical protein